MKRRDFLKMVGVAITTPAILLKADLAQLSKFKYQFIPFIAESDCDEEVYKVEPFDSGDLDIELTFPEGHYEYKDSRIRITAHKVNPKVYAFYLPLNGVECSRGMYKHSEKIEMTPINEKARLMFRKLSPTVVFEVRDIGCMIPGDKFNLDIPDEDKSGVYQIFRIEKVIKA